MLVSSRAPAKNNYYRAVETKVLWYLRLPAASISIVQTFILFNMIQRYQEMSSS